MVELKEEDRELVAEALRAAIIYIQQFPGDDSPIAQVRKALVIVNNAQPVGEVAVEPEAEGGT